MGCCGGRARGARGMGVKGIKSKAIRGVKMQKPKLKPKPIKVKSYGRGIVKKTCPKCGSVMSHSILKYDPLTKTSVQLWSCTNKSCRFKLKK